MKRTDKKNKIDQQRYDVRKLRNPDCRERIRIEQKKRFTVLEGMEDKEDVDTMWDEFKTAYNETAEVILGKVKEGCEKVGIRKRPEDYRRKKRDETEDEQYQID